MGFLSVRVDVRVQIGAAALDARAAFDQRQAQIHVSFVSVFICVYQWLRMPFRPRDAAVEGPLIAIAVQAA